MSLLLRQHLVKFWSFLPLPFSVCLFKCALSFSITMIIVRKTTQMNWSCDNYSLWQMSIFHFIFIQVCFKGVQEILASCSPSSIVFVFFRSLDGNLSPSMVTEYMYLLTGNCQLEMLMYPMAFWASPRIFRFTPVLPFHRDRPISSQYTGLPLIL